MVSSSARVTSLEALETFRAQLVVYVSKARPIIDEVGSDVLRLRLWLETEQRMHWENELRRRTKALEMAQQALFSARLCSLHKHSTLEEYAVQRARRAKDEAEEKLRVIRRWNRDFESRVQPLLKQVEKFQSTLDQDLAQAAAFLSQTLQILAEYASTAQSVAPASSAVPPAPASARPIASKPGSPASAQ